MSRVYNKRDKNVPSDAVYVGRPSKWGNRYPIPEHTREGSYCTLQGVDNQKDSNG